MSTVKATTQETTNSIMFFLGLSDAYTTDDEGYIVLRTDPEKRVMIKGSAANDPKRALVVYQESMPTNCDYFTVNPYAEGLGLTTPPNSFFYSTLRMDLVARLCLIVDSAVMFMMHQKGLAVPETEYTIIGTPKVLIDIASTKDVKGKPIADLVDDKTLSNIRSFIRPKVPGKANQHSVFRDLAYVAYSKNLMSAALKIDVISDPSYIETTDIKNMRKSDFQVLRGILMGALRLSKPEDLEQYTATAQQDTPPKMSAWLTVLFKAYKSINEALLAIDEDCVIPLSDFDHHLRNLPGYYMNARWQVQMTNHKQPEATNQIPGAGTTQMPQATSQTPGINQQAYPQQQQLPGTSLMPGAIRADGSVAPAQTYSAYGQPAYQIPSPNIPAPISINQYAQQPQYGQPGVPNYQQPGVMPAPMMMQQPGMMQPGMVQPGMGYPQQPGMGYSPAVMPGMGYPQYGQPVSSGNPPFYSMIAGGAAGGASPMAGFVGVR